MAVTADVLAALVAIDEGERARTLEGPRLEFKTQGRSREDTAVDLAEAVTCFANAGGGAVVVGVRDAPGGHEAFVGTGLDADALRSRIYQLTEPSLVVDVLPHAHEDVNLLVIAVPSSPTVHAVRGRATERIGSSCEPMTTERIASVVADRRGEDWSAGDSDTPLERVDVAAVVEVRRLLRQLADPVRRAYAEASDADLVRRLGLLTPRRTLTRAGQVLLTDAVPTEQVTYVYRRTPTGSVVVNEQLSGPLLLVLRRLLELVDARVDRTAVPVGGGQQLQVADLPEAAVREAVVNAVMHRDFRLPGRVTVQHAATRFSVTSPGSFVSGVTVDNVLTTSPRARNLQLAQAVRTLGLAETAGSGVDRMYAEMTRVGHQPPTFSADASAVEVVLTGGSPNTYLTRFVSTLPPGAADDADTMLVLLTLLSRRTTSAGALAPLLQRPVEEAQEVLERLSAHPLMLVEATRETSRRARPTYRLREQAVAGLGPAVTYRRRTVDESDRKVIELAREMGQINSRVVRLVLDTDVTATSRLLSDMVRRGLLVRTSTATRGPGVTYGLGLEAPSAPARGRRRRGGKGPPQEEEVLFDE
ncbi:ATP-binding protein [Pseudokineococcus basanitobsidens]|uniref:ATP-binding protein n=1 Tax=Pseudokineococcus basanitobsidens TaxID=1926649 RepID=A0ABU8RF34_9ACTN